jgi:drug/metabolite transporter (DMT)-like permease
MSNIKKYLILAFLCVVWGSTWIGIKISLEGFPPMLGASFRFVVGIIALLGYMKWQGISFKVTKKEFWFVAVTAFLVYVVDYGMIYWGEQYLSAGVTSIFFATFALFTALMSNFVFKNEPFNWPKFTGLMLGFAGILVVFYDQLAITQYNLKVMLASLAILIAALGAAMSLVIVKKFLPNIHTVTLTFHQLTMGTVFLLLLSVCTEMPLHLHINMRVISAIVYMGVVASAMAFVFYYRILQEMSAISLSFIIYVIPIVALLGDYLFFNEMLSIRAFIGMFVIFSGIWFSHYKKINS